MSRARNPSAHLRLSALIATWISYWLLIASLFAAAMAATTPMLLIVLVLLPLLLFLPGLCRRNSRSFAYLCFVALLYFTVIVTNLFKPDPAPADVISLVAVVTLFIAAMLCSRWHQARAAQPGGARQHESTQEPAHEQK